MDEHVGCKNEGKTNVFSTPNKIFPDLAELQSITVHPYGMISILVRSNMTMRAVI